MKKIVLASSAIAVLLGLSACAGSPVDLETPSVAQPGETSAAKASIAADSSEKATSTASSTPTPSLIRSEVLWADYDQGTQNEIDRMTNAGDCLGINSYFGMVTATEESVKSRTGHGNEALAKYLNESLAIAKCN